MNSNTLFVGWNRVVAGREERAGELFQEFQGYLGGLQKAGKIKSFDTVLLSPHGGDLNGFFLIRADSAKLDALEGDKEWFGYMTLAGLLLEGQGVVRGATGELIGEWMNTWGKFASM